MVGAKRKGFFFAIDVLVAITLVVILTVSIYRPLYRKSRLTNSYIEANNLMEYLSSVRVRDLPSKNLEELGEKVSTEDLYLSEAMGELYWKSRNGCGDCLQSAFEIANNVTEALKNPSYAYIITIGNSTEKTELVHIEPEPGFIKKCSNLISLKKIIFVMNNTNLANTYILNIEVASK